MSMNETTPVFSTWSTPYWRESGRKGARVTTTTDHRQQQQRRRQQEASTKGFAGGLLLMLPQQVACVKHPPAAIRCPSGRKRTGGYSAENVSSLGVEKKNEKMYKIN